MSPKYLPCVYAEVYVIPKLKIAQFLAKMSWRFTSIYTKNYFMLNCKVSSFAKIRQYVIFHQTNFGVKSTVHSTVDTWFLSIRESSKNLLLFSEMVFCIIQRKLVLFWGRLHILWADGTQSKWRNFPCFGAQSAALKSAIFHFSLRRAIWMKRNILKWIQVKFKFKSLNSKVEQILISAISDYRS